MRSIEAEACQLCWSLVGGRGLTNLSIFESLRSGCHSQVVDDMGCYLVIWHPESKVPSLAHEKGLLR